jgi:hypothetical protein
LLNAKPLMMNRKMQPETGYCPDERGQLDRLAPPK